MRTSLVKEACQEAKIQMHIDEKIKPEADIPLSQSRARGETPHPQVNASKVETRSTKSTASH